ncbi:MAG: hypothetical protein R3E79_46465 [Caldilineaceae bacterium]
MAHQQLEFDEFARLVLDALEAAQLDYLIGGAVAVWAWGEARTTQDFDVVVDLPVSHITRLSEELAKRGMLVPPEILLDLLLETRGDLPVNALHLHSKFKAELFLLRPWDEYRRVSFTRRRLVNLGLAFGEVYVHSPEDLILNKVYYFGLSQQTKHIRDIASIIANMADELDWAYLEEWAQKLNLTAAWYELLGEVDKLLGTGQ